MLPFLPSKKIATIMIARKKEGEPQEMGPEEDHPLLSAAEDLIEAIHSKDVGMVAQALEAAIQIMDSEPQGEQE